MKAFLIRPALAAICGLAVAWASSSAANAALLAHWSFDEPAGATALNDSIGANHSTSIGTATPGAVGQIDGAWTFSGSDDAIAIDAATGDLTGLVDYSFSAWIKSTDNLGVILSISDNTQGSEEVALRITDNGTPDGRVGLLGRPNIVGPGGEALSTTFVNDDLWHHVAFTSHAAGWSIYVDGVLENSGTSPTSPMAIGANAVHIGVNQDNTAAQMGLQWGLNGTLDDVAVFNTAIDSGTIGEIYRGGLQGRSVTDVIPEPASFALFAIGGLWLAWRPRR